MTDFLDEKRQQIADRLKELKPLVDEHNRLEAAASALAKLGAPAPAATAAAATTTTPAATPRRRPGRPRGSTNRASRATPAASPAATPAATPVKAAPKKAASRKARRGRRKGSGTRAAQALSVVQGQPGITIPELATKMGIQATYLYRVLPGLEQEGKVEKKGRGLFPREGS
jgi:ribosomal protein S25